MRGLPFRTVGLSASIVLGLTLAVGGAAPGASAKTRPAASRPAASGPDLPEAAEIGAYRTRLLDVAYRAASAYPIVPHIKNRSRAQEDVVNASIELGQPERALRYIEGIENWRRGAGFARLAGFCAERGHREVARRLIDRAKRIAGARWLETWRKDRIRVEIARVQTLLGRDEQASGYGTGVVASEKGKLAIARIERAEKIDVAERLARIDELADSGELGPVKNALRAYVALYGRAYGNPEQRARIRKRIESSLDGLPYFLRVERFMDLAEKALGAGDPSTALALVDEAEATMDEAKWRLHRGIAYRARLAELRYRAGERDAGLAQLESQLTRYERNEGDIEDLHRASALRPIAEAFAAMDRPARSRKAYTMALGAGAINLNIRPRISDLVATCCSMALHGVEPTDEFWDRVNEIVEDLDGG